MLSINRSSQASSNYPMCYNEMGESLWTVYIGYCSLLLEHVEHFNWRPPYMTSSKTVCTWYHHQACWNKRGVATSTTTLWIRYWWVHEKLHMHRKSPTKWNVFTSNYSLTFVGMLGSAPPWRSSWTTELCPPVLAVNTAVSPSCKEREWRYMRYTVCYHGDIKVSYSSGTIWLTVRRILTQCVLFMWNVFCTLDHVSTSHLTLSLQ